MTLEVAVSKNMHGNWQAENWVDLPNGKGLRVLTCKRSSGDLVTSITAGESKNGMFTYAPFTDYNAYPATTAGRCTSGAVATQHGGVMGRIEEYKKAALEHYAK